MAFAKLNSMKFVGLDGLNHFWTKAKTWIINRITTEVTAKIAEVVANAPEDLDTLKEIADWISSHANDAAAMNTAILANTEAISGKADKIHTHTKSEITDFPTSLPANGGTADTAKNAVTADAILDYNRGTPIYVRWGGPVIDSAEWYPAFNADGSALEPINKANIHAGTADKIRIGNSHPIDGDIWIQ